ncbi:hypothetical protein [Shimazuella soli]|uniref:hypothetical protein n=1 Tax=Shimazuella soli TaxID=1892854 RepID=UPI001F0E6C9E|nr:hypothetical protein [Shimazuella soli]
MHDNQNTAPDHTAVRVALWRVLHVQVDSPPYILKDKVGLIGFGPQGRFPRSPTCIIG